eukprot:NODE_242_length_1818_cov_114.302188_g216_i0.p1 GENE.NODE_242_length_1818_cov_114.302188_g216_i0~~NODE_242_length_1818_cov_114.302188_g216_i0.p1  ORF type:complete len:593 (-),score=114.97 NODE_242_length_1818_cov_114.302188_g216_i0:39-1745(-)
MAEKMLNFNVGILGHVDSGKTSLSKALSTQASTACFDKNPQSRERGITLDLGFSSFLRDLPPHLSDAPYSSIQYTLVDCPGHASLIRTIIGGAQIIDLMILVIDVTKGIQTQTGECIVIGEILAKDLIVVLNKVDMLTAADAATRDQLVQKKIKQLRTSVFSKTRWPNAPMVPVAANPGAQGAQEPIGLDALVAEIQAHTYVPQTTPCTYDDFLMAIDHCFAIKGQGTVVTGTVVRGCIDVGQNLQFPELKIEKKVKSIQVFKKPVQSCSRGDRCGVCVTQFNPENMERGLACAAPAAGKSVLVQSYSTAIADVERVRFYKQSVCSNSKIHVTVGHTTVMATVRFIATAKGVVDPEFSFDTEYRWMAELPEEANYTPATPKSRTWYAVLFFDSPVVTAIDASLIASKLDVDVHSPTCRLMFFGKLVAAIDQDATKRIRAIKDRCKTAQIARVTDSNNAIANNLLKSKQSDLTPFIGMTILYQPTALLPGSSEPDTPPGPVFVGKLEETFGKSGKFKVSFTGDPFEKGKVEPSEYTLALHFQVNQFDKTRSIQQSKLTVLPGSVAVAAT